MGEEIRSTFCSLEKEWLVGGPQIEREGYCCHRSQLKVQHTQHSRHIHAYRKIMSKKEFGPAKTVLFIMVSLVQSMLSRCFNKYLIDF